MADNVQKAVDANAEGAGNAISTVSKSGTIQKVDRDDIASTRNDITRLNAWVLDRIANNPDYYTA